VVSIATEIQLGETTGMMNIGMPSSIVKLLRQKFDQQWAPRRSNATEDEIDRTLAHIGTAGLDFEVRVDGSAVRFADLLELSEGDILQFDQRSTDMVSVYVNNTPKWQGKVLVSGRRRAVSLERVC